MTDTRSEETYDKAKDYWKNVESTTCGMLGNLPLLHPEDIRGSTLFLRQLFKHKPAPGQNRALDCGAGIGRVSKHLLANEFNTVDILEQDEKFCEKARESLSQTNKLGCVFNVGLQDFTESEFLYDVIWCQWFLGHLLDKDLIESFIRLSRFLAPNGVIVVKENFTNSADCILDETDSSVTRNLKHFKNLVKEANLRVVKESKQLNFPKDIYPVFMLAIKKTR